MLSLVLGALVVLSAIGVGAAAVAQPMIVKGLPPAWMLFGFEVVTLVAGVLAVFFGRGRFGDGPGLALACIAGTIVFASAFGWISSGRQVAGQSLTPLLGLRVVAGGVLAACGAFCVLSRNPKSWRVAALGAALGMPFLIVAGAALNGGTRRVLVNLISGGGAVQTGLALFGVVIIGGMLCASVHLIIRAFELGRVEAGQA